LRSEKHTFPLFAVYDAVMLRNIRDHRVRDDENDAQWDAGQQDDEKSGIVRNERSEQAGKSEQQRKEASRQQKERLFRHKRCDFLNERAESQSEDEGGTDHESGRVGAFFQ